MGAQPLLKPPGWVWWPGSAHKGRAVVAWSFPRRWGRTTGFGGGKSQQHGPQPGCPPASVAPASPSEDKALPAQTCLGGWGQAPRDLGVKFASVCTHLGASVSPPERRGPGPRLTLILGASGLREWEEGPEQRPQGNRMGRARGPELPSAWPLPGAWEGEADARPLTPAGPSLSAPPSESACLATRTRPCALPRGRLGDLLH